MFQTSCGHATLHTLFTTLALRDVSVSAIDSSNPNIRKLAFKLCRSSFFDCIFQSDQIVSYRKSRQHLITAYLCHCVYSRHLLPVLKFCLLTLFVHNQDDQPWF